MAIKVGDKLEILVNNPWISGLGRGDIVTVLHIEEDGELVVSGNWHLGADPQDYFGVNCYRVLNSQSTHQDPKTYHFDSPMHGYWCELREIPNDLSRYWYRSDVVKDWGKVWYDPGENFQTVLNHYKLTLYWTENNPGTQFTDLGLEIKDVPKEDTPVPKHKCRCEMSVLWTRGCGCGGI